MSADDLLADILAAEKALSEARSELEYTPESYRSLAAHHDAVATIYRKASDAEDVDTFAYHASTWLYVQHHVDAGQLRKDADQRETELAKRAALAGGR